MFRQNTPTQQMIQTSQVLFSIIFLLVSHLGHAKGVYEIQAVDTGILSDVEGVYAHWTSQATQGVISISNDSLNPTVALSPGHALWSLGDHMRRGVYGCRSIEFSLSLREADPVHFAQLLGNHDLNIIGLHALLPAMELGMVSPYQEYLTKHQLPHSLVNGLLWWAEFHSLKDKVKNFWIETAARKLKLPVGSEEYHSLIQVEGKISEAKLAEIMNIEEMTEKFFAYTGPGGKAWEYLEKGELIRVIKSKDARGVTTKSLLLHSGMLTEGNLGQVIATPNFFTEYSDNPELALDKWVEALNESSDSQLKSYVSLLAQYKAMTRATEKQAIAKEILSLDLRKSGDAGWDPVTNKLTYDAQSVVYPNTDEQKNNDIPGLPEQKILDTLASARVDYVFGGHKPVGDGPVFFVGLGTDQKGVKRMIRIVRADTSYSPVEGRDHLMLTKEGGLKAEWKTRDGLRVKVEIPAEHVIESLEKSESGADQEKAKSYRRLGMISNGYLVAGFAVDANGNLDYNNYVLVKQEGRNFDYRVVDQYGLDSTKLEYAMTDLAEIAQKAKKEKLEMIKNKTGKEALTESEFLDMIAGKKLIISSGPAAKSLSEVTSGEFANPGRLEAYLREWRSRLEAIGANESIVLLGGGTTGLEREKNRVAQEVNAIRRANGAMPMKICGAITGVTSSEELDPHVERFLVLEAFYWSDYLEEMVKLVNKGNPRSIHFDFAGGGGIVTDQIRFLRSLMEKGLTFALSLYEGITSKNMQKSSATDKAIKAILKDPTTSGQISVHQLNADGTYRQTRGGLALMMPRLGSRCLSLFNQF